MATATAKGGRAKGTKGPKAPPAKKKPRAPKGQGKSPARQNALVIAAMAENPLMTSDEFAAKYNLPFEEVARHRGFALQFLLDYNPKAAAMRLGYPEDTAAETGKLMLAYGWTQLFIMECQRRATAESVVTSGQIMAAAWREANAPNLVVSGCAMTNSGTRLTALTLCAKIAGLLTPKPKEVAVTVRRIMYVGEGKLQPPSGAPSPDEWGQVARPSQKALKASTTIDV